MQLPVNVPGWIIQLPAVVRPRASVFRVFFLERPSGAPDKKKTLNPELAVAHGSSELYESDRLQLQNPNRPASVAKP